jgi:hypothetical protein
MENFDRKLFVNCFSVDDEWTSQMTIQTSPMSTEPYGFWRNDTSVVIATSDWLFMEKTAFNYSCMPENPNPGCGTNLRMPDMNTVSGMPILQQCTMLVKILADLFGIKIEFCEEVMLIHNIEVDTIGIKTMGQICMVKVQEGEKIQNLWVSEGSYRFFRQLSYIACFPQGDGLYTNCSDGELVLIEARDMGYDEAVEVVVEVGPVGNNGLSIDVSGFSSLLDSKTKNIFLIVGIVVGSIVLLTITIVVICPICNYCSKRVVVT